MATLYYDKDADLSLLQWQDHCDYRLWQPGTRPRAESPDSGNVILDCTRAAKAAKRGRWFKVFSIADAMEEADIVMILLPDAMQAKVYTDSIGPNLKPGSMLMFATASTFTL